MVELASCGGDGAAGPAAGSVSALGVGADVGVGGVGVNVVGVESADEGVVCGGVVEVYPSGTGVKDEVGFLVGGEGVDGDAGVGVGPGPRKVDTSGVSYAAWVSVAELSASKSSGARRLHQECRLRVL